MKETDCIASIIQRISGNGTACIIAVAGGSCTGKTTFLHDLESRLNTPFSTISLDDYQQGEAWDKRNASPYGWDDPDHFSIPEMEQAVARYMKGQDVEVPHFSLKQNRRDGKRMVKHEATLIMDGLYVMPPFFHPEAELRVYIEAPFYIRLIRRVVRFITEVQPTDRSIPLRHMTMNTARAHANFVLKQKTYATHCVSSTFSYEAIHGLFLKMPQAADVQGIEIASWSFLDRIRFVVRKTQDGPYFLIFDGDAPVYGTPMLNEWLDSLLKIDMLSL